MSRAFTALFYALFITVFFTLDSLGLTRIDHLGYHPANNTMPTQKQWNPNPNLNLNPHSPSQQNIATTPHNPYQGWSQGGAQPSPVAVAGVNPWHRYNNTNSVPVGYNNGYQNSSMANQWLQRHNNTPARAGTYNPGLPGWNPPQQTHLPNANNSWQQPSQGHLYPQLPQPNSGWAGVRPQPFVPTTPASYNPNLNPNPNRWNNTHARWNNTFLPPQQYPAGAGSFPNQNNWPMGGQNQTWSNAPTVPPANNPNYSKVPQNFPGSNLPNQTAGVNWWNRPNATNNNNYGWGNNPAQNNWGAAGSNVGQNNWRNGPTNAAGNGWSNGAQENWRGNSNDMRNTNWPNPARDNNGIQGNSGAPLAPIGSGTSTSGGVPLAPIGGNNAMPNTWNAGANNSPQLAPLAPLSYGVNDPNDPSKKGNTNPYARIFN